jgi:hypothetical protein
MPQKTKKMHFETEQPLFELGIGISFIIVVFDIPALLTSLRVGLILGFVIASITVAVAYKRNVYKYVALTALVLNILQLIAVLFLSSLNWSNFG